MADQSLSSQAGPVDIVYELGDAGRPPIPPKEPETKTHDVQQPYQAAANVPTRSQSGYAPQVLSKQEHSPGAMSPVPSSPIGSPNSPQPSMGYAPPQDSPPIGHQGHRSLAAASTVSPITYRDSYQTQSDAGSRMGDQNFTQPKYAGTETSYANQTNAPAPHYNAPVAGYYVPPGQYNPNQSYSVGAAPYPQVHSPPPIKSEATFYGGAPPPAPPAGVAGADGGKKKKKFCGMSVTLCSLLCVALFLIIAAAILGGGFGSGKWLPHKPGPSPDTTSTSPPVSSSITTTDTSITTSFTTTTTTTTSPTGTTTSYPYPIPTGVWSHSGGLNQVSGTCINDPNTNNYHEVWYCENTQPYSGVIKDVSTASQLAYTLDLDTPVRAVGVQGSPPTGPDSNKGDQLFWMFSVSYTRDAFNGTGCPVNMNLVFLLGNTKLLFGMVESVKSPRTCTLPYGGNSTAGITCFCGYL